MSQLGGEPSNEDVLTSMVGSSASLIPGGPIPDLSPVRRPTIWPLAASSVLHGLLLAALLLLTTVKPIPSPPIRSIDVQLLSEGQYQASIKPNPATPTATPMPAPMPLAVPPPTAPDKRPEATSTKEAPAPNDGMTQATTLYSTGLLKELASAEVRKTLPTLAPYERITQLCNIEATEQIRRALKDSNPETVAASAFAETTLAKGIFAATGAAYRSHRKWFAIAFTCVVRSDLAGVADFSFRLGPPIPKDQWESHNLIAVDSDDEGPLN